MGVGVAKRIPTIGLGGSKLYSRGAESVSGVFLEFVQKIFRKVQPYAGYVGRTPKGSCNNTLLRRVLRRFSSSKCFLEGFLEGACKGFQ